MAPSSPPRTISLHCVLSALGPSAAVSTRQQRLEKQHPDSKSSLPSRIIELSSGFLTASFHLSDFRVSSGRRILSALPLTSCCFDVGIRLFSLPLSLPAVASHSHPKRVDMAGQERRLYSQKEVSKRCAKGGILFSTKLLHRSSVLEIIIVVWNIEQEGSRLSSHGWQLSASALWDYHLEPPPYTVSATTTA